MKPTREKMIATLRLGKIRLWNRWRIATNISSLDLQDANLQGANLQGAYLRDAYLRGANLQDANLQGANLRDANLQNANLQGANLQGANLRGAYLRGAKGILQFGPMRSSGRLCYVVEHEESVFVNAGCFWGTTQELRTRVQDDTARWDYLLLCDWAERVFQK